MNNHIKDLVIRTYASSPLNRFRDRTKLDEALLMLNVHERLTFLSHSFSEYNYHYNFELCLAMPFLWNTFKVLEWENLILEMFPRKISFQAGDFRAINTGCYFDIALLNGIIEVSPFEFIFSSKIISQSEKRSLYKFMRVFGINYWQSLPKVTEAVADFYGSTVLDDIIRMRNLLVKTVVFDESYTYDEFCLKFIEFAV